MLWYSNLFSVTVTNGVDWIMFDMMVGLDENLYITKARGEGERVPCQSSLLRNCRIVCSVVSDSEQSFFEGMFMDNLGTTYSRVLSRKSRKSDKFKVGEYQFSIKYYNKERYDERVSFDNALARKNVTCRIPAQVILDGKIWTYKQQ